MSRQSVLNIFSDIKEPTAVTTKRNNPCGAAVRTNALGTYKNIKSHNTNDSNKCVKLEMRNVRNSTL